MSRWRNSASIILAANFKQNLKEQVIKPAYDYKLLTLKRHQNSSFLPGNYVFPGGTVDLSDLDIKWKNLYKKCGFDDNHFSSLSPNSDAVRPLIFQVDSGHSHQLPKEVSLRITAIRETFEECGVLLCRPSKEKASSNWINNFSLNQTSLKEWQNKVHENGSEFYNLCETFDCYPDLWALYEWGNWLTPAAFEGKRFNTIFFMIFMKTMPLTKHEANEIEDLSWNFPNELIESSAKFKLPPPQFYEISKISKFNCLNNLLHSAVDHNKSGIDFKLPVLVKLSDGVVYLLPGDAEYSGQHIEHGNVSIDQFRNASGAKHRVEISKDKNRPRKLIQNYQ